MFHYPFKGTPCYLLNLGKPTLRNMIHCCSEHSEYDAATGALYATGTLGSELFNAFFAKYEMRLTLDYGSGRAKERIANTSVVTELTNYCKQQVRC